MLHNLVDTEDLWNTFKREAPKLECVQGQGAFYIWEAEKKKYQEESRSEASGNQGRYRDLSRNNKALLSRDMKNVRSQA